jgi:3-oxoacyl-[acyl-carrier-protein] synthase II
MTSQKHRVFITGLGVITCIGSGKENLWKGILSEKTGILPLQRFDTSPYRAKMAGEIRDFDPSTYFPTKRIKRLDRHSQLALACAKMAIKDSGIDPQPDRKKTRWGVSTGTGLGGISDAERENEKFLQSGTQHINPLLAILIFGGASSSNISIEFGLTGPCYASSNSCASGNIAIGEAYRYLRDGYADLMIAGAAEAPLSPLTFAAFDRIHAMSTGHSPENSCRPFDRLRSGFVMGEGAGMLVLETEAHAQARGAPIYAEILGYSLNSDAFHMTSSLSSGECAARCMNDAIQTAGLRPQDIHYINAHASSTPMNDLNETTGIKLVFGAEASKIPISGTKPYHAHPLGATSAIEAVICALALQHQYIPPTLHLQEPDPECDLDYTPLHGRNAPLRYILSNAFGFGGVNSCLVMGKI